MIVVRVELHSALTKRRTELARMHIANDGEATLTNPRLGDYHGATFVGRDSAALDREHINRRGTVSGWRRHDFHVWNLVRRMLEAMGYDKGAPGIPDARDLPLLPDDGERHPSLDREGLIDLVMREATDRLVVVESGQRVGEPNNLTQGCRYVRNDLPGYENPPEAARAFAGFIVDALLPAIKQTEGALRLAARVEEQAIETGGHWRSCSGCYETNEGYDTGPHSPIFKTPLGCGCSECGGIGAVWDNTDWEAAAASMLANMSGEFEACPTCHGGGEVRVEKKDAAHG